ncbi:MAG: ABC transporter permease [Peptococcaceae bacterium]|nr:ABC transporter permease [Peptococcaceae bacterium]
MLNLIKTEIQKNYTHKVTLIGFLLVAAMVFIVALWISVQIERASDEDWRLNLDQDNQIYEIILHDESIVVATSNRNNYTAQIVINTYRLEHDLKPFAVHSASNLLLRINDIFMIVIILTIFITAKIFTDEYRDKTLQYLLISPNQRWKILTAKLVASFVMPLMIVFFLLFTSIIIGWGFFGYDNFSSEMVRYVDGQILSSPLLLQVLINFAFSSVGLIACVLLTVMISVLFKNGIVSVLTSIGFYYFGNVICYNLRDLGWLKYTLFPNINFQMYLTTDIPFVGMSPSFSLIVILLYSLPMLFVSYYSFVKQDY